MNKICRKIKLKKRTAAHMKQFHLEVFLDSTLKLWIYSSESYRCISVCLLSSVSNWKSQLKTIISMILNCYSCIWSPYCSIEIKAGAEVTISFRRKPDDILFSRKFFFWKNLFSLDIFLIYTFTHLKRKTTITRYVNINVPRIQVKKAWTKNKEW